MAVTGFWGSTPGSVSYNPGWHVPDATEFATPPADLDAGTFASWTREKQVQYIEAHGTGNPRSLTIGTGDTGTLVSLVEDGALKLALPDESGREFTNQSGGRPATPAELQSHPSQISSDTFLSWRREDQIAYLRANTAGTHTFHSTTGAPRVTASLEPDVMVGSGVIQSTSGDDHPIPYHYLSGSDAGALSAIVRASAEALFPSLDGAATRLSVANRPPEFSIPFTELGTDADARERFLASFSSWHSAYQLEYIKQHGSDGVLDIPGGPTAVASSVDPTRLYIIDSLDKTAIGLIPPQDMARISALPKFQALAATLGLASASAPAVESVVAGQQKLTAQDAVEELRHYIDQHGATNRVWRYQDDLAVPAAQPPLVYEPEYTDTYRITYVYTGTAGGLDLYDRVMEELMPPDDRAAFTSQLDTLSAQLEDVSAIDPAQIRARLSALKERFDRAFAFWDVVEVTVKQEHMGDPSVTIDTHYNVVSQGASLAGINAAYQSFISQEKRIAELAAERLSIARNLGSGHGRNLDVPYLVYKFQSLYNLSMEAEVVMETEEVNQQNELLKTYAAMQELVNRTVGLFKDPNGSSKHILDYNVDALGMEPRGEPPTYPGVPLDRQLLISMFENNLGAGQLHPLERLKDVSRPLFNMFDMQPGTIQNFDLVAYNHAEWNQYGIRLSEAVTLINQNSQIKMNEINTLDKQRNRHFDLANSALAKMNEILMNIARA